MSQAPKHPSRRQFLKGAGIAGAASMLSASSASALSPAVVEVGPKQAKNVIFLVVDGMCSGTLALAHHWSLRNRNAPLNWMQLYGRAGVTRAMQDTASASSPVTDSAAASSAWGCGERVKNGSINFTTEGKPRTPIMAYAKAAGKATGLVTTCKVTHATPAGFAANVKSRGLENEIAEQYLEREIDVLLGGGASKFSRKMADPNSNSKKRQTVSILPEFEAKGYSIVRDRAALLAAAGQPKLLGLFDDSDHIPYALDRANDPSLKHVPGLAEMFRAALKSLESAQNGFCLQVEGGRVDHAGHANDPATILHELLEFDTCIPIALDFVEKHPDTLLIITTDHGTGGCQLNGKGKAYAESGPALDTINQFKYSFEWLQRRFMGSGMFSPEIFKMATGIELSEKQVAQLQKAIDTDVKYLSSEMTKMVEDDLQSLTAVGWTSSNHTSECVELFAMGPTSETVPAFVENYKMFYHMTDAMGLKVKG